MDASFDEKKPAEGESLWAGLKRLAAALEYTESDYIYARIQHLEQRLAALEENSSSGAD